MNVVDVYLIAVLIAIIATCLHSSNIRIINPPQNTTVCMDAIAEVACGFTGTDPNGVVPDWNIIKRNEDGSIISNETVFGGMIIGNLTTGLLWIFDLTSGVNHSPNSKLLVGPVNTTHNQSSYHCRVGARPPVTSIAGTITVVDPPTVTINVDETCATSIVFSLNIHSHPSCGEVVLHEVAVTTKSRAPRPAVPPVEDNYRIDSLKSDTAYKITVTIAYNNISSFGMFNKSVKTSVLKPPSPIDINSIEAFINATERDVLVIWEEPVINICSMSTIEHYDVRVNSSVGDSFSITTNSTEFHLSKHFVYHSNMSYTFSVVAVGTGGLRSQQVSKNIQGTESSTKSGRGGSSTAAIVGAVVGVVAIITLLMVFLTVLVFLKQHHQHEDHTMELKERAEENNYVETSSGGSNTPSDANQIENGSNSLNDSSSINGDQQDTAPPLPPRVTYADIEVCSDRPAPRNFDVDSRVAYAETKPTQTD